MGLADVGRHSPERVPGGHKNTVRVLTSLVKGRDVASNEFAKCVHDWLGKRERPFHLAGRVDDLEHFPIVRVG
jgi:hypothetical protein